MEQSINGDDNDIEVQFIDDQSVIHIIKDETVQGNTPKLLTGTLKRRKDIAHKSAALIKSKKSNRTSIDNSYDKEHSDNELNTILKPKALFVDGDVPGELMFSFNSKHRKSSTNQLSIPKASTNKKKINKINVIKQHNKSNQDDDIILFDDVSENKSKTPYKKLTRSSYKSASPNVKNEILNNDSKFGYVTPTKSKTTHTPNNFKIKIDTECTPSINLTPKTPRSKKYVSTEDMETKTPKTVRKLLAKGIAIQKNELLNELNYSDYSISDKSDESDSNSNDSNDNVLQSQVKVSRDVSLRRSCRKKEVPYVYKCEEYFLSKSAKSIKKSKTSDNTLKLLKNPALDKEQVDKLSEDSNTTHKKKLNAIYKEIISNFPYWLCLLKEGFNLLLYGFGSKRQIINDFRISMLENESVLVINGFFPGLTLKEILESLTIDLLALDSCPGSAELVIQQIEEKQKLKNAEHIYILIHNLDGVELQNYKIQHVISRICSLKNVHLIASIDRVNAALMCDNTKLGDYNFIWMDCTNYLPYTVETDFVQSVMVKNIGTQHSLSGLNNVFKSLTSNTKQILLLLIKDRIANKNDKKYGGVPFSILYRWCRQQFLVSTDLALRSQLTEFVDHELVKWKRDADVLYVPVDVDVLIQFYKQNEEDNE